MTTLAPERLTRAASFTDLRAKGRLVVSVDRHTLCLFAVRATDGLPAARAAGGGGAAAAGASTGLASDGRLGAARSCELASAASDSASAV